MILDKEGDTDESLKAIEFGVDYCVVRGSRSDGEQLARKQFTSLGRKHGSGREQFGSKTELTRTTFLLNRIEYQPASAICSGTASTGFAAEHQ